MKRILSFIALAIAMAMLLSCTKEELKTTYTININISSLSSSSGVKVDFTAYEYNDAGEKIVTNDLIAVTAGTTKTFTANSRSVKVKIYQKVYTSVSSIKPTYSWVQQVFYLEPGKNININLDDHTKIGNYEP